MERNAKQAGASLKRRSPGGQARASEDNVKTNEEMNVMQNSTTVIDLRQFIEAKGGKPFTSSLNVAKAFDKQHHHVMQKLDALDCSDQFLTSNFSRVQFEHRGNQYDACEMTKDGFMFLVMGFTGKKAAAVKEGYIAAFNWMAEQLGSSGGEQVNSILRSTIGTDGFHMLGAIIKGKVVSLPQAVQRRATAKIWSQTHAAFGVRSAADIPADQLDAARNFIAAYAIEGEFLPRQEESGIKLTDSQAIALNLLVHHIAWVAHYWNAGIGQAAQSMDSPMFPGLHGHLRDCELHRSALDSSVIPEIKAMLAGKLPAGSSLGLRPAGMGVAA